MRRLIVAIVLLASIAGCAVQPVALSAQARQSLGTVQTVLYVPQSNVEIDITPGNPGNTGLIGALIVAVVDEARRTKAQKELSGVTDAAEGFGFGERIRDQLNAEFARVGGLRLSAVQLEATDSPSQRRIAYDRAATSAILFIRADYKIIDGNLVVVASSEMFSKAPVPKGQYATADNADPLDAANVIYRSKLSFTRQAVSRDNVRQGMAQGLVNVAWQLAADLNHSDAEAAARLGSPLPIVRGDLDANWPPVGVESVPSVALEAPVAPTTPVSAPPAPSVVNVSAAQPVSRPAVRTFESELRPGRPANVWRPVRGASLDYTITDRETSRQALVMLQVDRVDDQRVLFNGGARIEQTNGDLVTRGAPLLGELDAVTPPGGWMPAGKVPRGSWPVKFTSGVPGQQTQYDLTARAGGEQVLRLKAGEFRAVRIDLDGWIERTGVTTARAHYEGVLWLSPDLKRPVRFEAKSRTGGGIGGSAFSIDEAIELSGISKD